MDWHNFSSLQLVVNDLNEIAADAYRHRIRPRAKKGGNGAYDTSNGGFVYLLPRRYEVNTRARFEIIQILPDAVVLKAVSLEDQECFLQAIIDGRGQLTQLEFPAIYGAPVKSPQVHRQVQQPQQQLQPIPVPVRPIFRRLKVYGDF
jgi:hypothetical protein